MANQTPGFFAAEKTAARPRSAAYPHRSTLSPVRRAYQAVVLVGYAVLGVAVPMVVSAIREWRR
jgi:hypothetical protein